MVEKSFPDDFINSLKEGENERVKSMIENKALYDFVDDGGTHALHLAAKFNNRGIISFLINRGCELEVEDSSGTTPLITALMYGNYDAGNLLFRKIIRPRLFQGASPRVDEFRFRAKVLDKFAAGINSKLRERSFNSEQIGEILAQMHFELSSIISLNDPATTKAYLQSEEPTYRANDDHFILYREVMPGLDIKYMQSILHDGRWPKQRMEDFCFYIIHDILYHQKTRTGRNFLKRIISLDIFHEDDAFHFLEEVLARTARNNVKIFLQYGLHLTVKEKFGRDLLACLFGNHSSNMIFSLFKRKVINVDVDGRGYQGNTPLHYAVKELLVNNVEFLLRNGADPNALNDLNETPVTLAMRDIEVTCLKPMLLGGTDYAFIYDQLHHCWLFNAEQNSRETIDRYNDAVKLLASQLAVFEAMGLSIEKFVEIYNSLCTPALKNFYQECRQQLKQLKESEIRGNLNDQKAQKIDFNLFTILTEKPEKIARYIGEEDLLAIATFVKYTRKTLYSFYRELLRRRVVDIGKIIRCKSKAIELTCKCIGIYDPNHLVIDKIVNYLSVKDLLKFENTSSLTDNSSLAMLFRKSLCLAVPRSCINGNQVYERLEPISMMFDMNNRDVRVEVCDCNFYVHIWDNRKSRPKIY